MNQCLNLKVKELVYFADTKYLPYGNKTPEFLIERGRIITNYFLSQNIDTIVIACHTSSATSLLSLKNLFPQVTYIDMLPPTIDMAIKKTKTGRIGIMATQTSIDTHVHKTLLLEQNSALTVFEQACPDFVPLIENQAPEEKIKKTIQKYLFPLLENKIDTLILGCTHYAFLEKQIQQEALDLNLISAANCLTLTTNLNVKPPKITIQATGTINITPFIQETNYEKILNVTIPSSSELS